MVTTASAVQFARAVAALARTANVDLFTTVMLLVLPCLALTLAAHELLAWRRAGIAPDGADLGLVAYVGAMAAVLTGWYLAKVAAPRRSLAALLTGYALGGAALAALAAAPGGWRGALIGAALGSAAVALAQVVLTLTLPLRRRRVLGREADAPVRLLGSRPIHEIVRSRLELAARNLPEPPSARPPRIARLGPSGERGLRISARIEAELRRLADHRRHALRPLLGSGAAAGDRLTLERAARQIANPDDLPAVLQAAIALHASTDAVTLLDGLAVVLPAGSPLEAAAPTRSARRSAARRSDRAPYEELLAALDDAFLLRWLVDLSGSDRIADRLLASRIVGIEDSLLRDALVGIMGIGRLVQAARLAPVHTDETGALYLLGPASDPLAYVRVADATAGAAGSPAQPWLKVPPHVATAREAVAWTFGMSEQSYSPSAET